MASSITRWRTCAARRPALTNATFPYAKRLARSGWKQACRDDGSLFQGLNVIEGRVVYPAVAESFGLSLADAKELV